MNVLAKAGKNSAPGQYLGYALQPVRLCYHLLSAPDGASVSLEHLDDVAVHLANGSTEIEQCKSAIGSRNPLSDWATDLWKTLANWADLLAAGEVSPATTSYRLYVTPPKSGSFAAKLHEAASDKDVADFVALVSRKLSKLTEAPACEAYLQRFLDADPVHRSALIKNAKVVSLDADPLDPIRAIFKRTVSPLVVDLICERAIGAAKEAADRLIRANKPAILSVDKFCAEQRAFVQKNNLPGLLTSFTESPPAEAVQQMMQGRPAFVRQLELVEAGSEACLRAVSDYLRTAADISVWGESGLIFEKNLADWDEDLVGRYQHIAAEVQDVHAAHPPNARGRIVYRRCAGLQAPLDGRAVPGHFVHGSYNALADELRLGWHPEFKTLMEPASSSPARR